MKYFWTRLVVRTVLKLFCFVTNWVHVTQLQHIYCRMWNHYASGCSGVLVWGPKVFSYLLSLPIVSMWYMIIAKRMARLMFMNFAQSETLNMLVRCCQNNLDARESFRYKFKKTRSVSYKKTTSFWNVDFFQVLASFGLMCRCHCFAETVSPSSWLLKMGDSVSPYHHYLRTSPNGASTQKTSTSSPLSEPKSQFSENIVCLTVPPLAPKRFIWFYSNSVCIRVTKLMKKLLIGVL
jgi:hypothetical protein